MAYNSAIHESTGFTPHKLMFGRERETPLSSVFPEYLIHEKVELSEFVRRHVVGLAIAHDVARKNRELAIQRQVRNYDRRVHDAPTLEIGQRVLALVDAKEREKGHKLQCRYMGPYRVTAILNEGYTYELDGEKLIHWEKLRPYNSDLHHLHLKRSGEFETDWALADQPLQTIPAVEGEEAYVDPGDPAEDHEILREPSFLRHYDLRSQVTLSELDSLDSRMQIAPPDERDNAESETTVESQPAPSLQNEESDPERQMTQLPFPLTPVRGQSTSSNVPAAFRPPPADDESNSMASDATTPIPQAQRDNVVETPEETGIFDQQEQEIIDDRTIDVASKPPVTKVVKVPMHAHNTRFQSRRSRHQETPKSKVAELLGKRLPKRQIQPRDRPTEMTEEDRRALEEAWKWVQDNTTPSQTCDQTFEKEGVGERTTPHQETQHYETPMVDREETVENNELNIVNESKNDSGESFEAKRGEGSPTPSGDKNRKTETIDSNPLLSKLNRVLDEWKMSPKGTPPKATSSKRVTLTAEPAVENSSSVRVMQGIGSYGILQDKASVIILDLPATTWIPKSNLRSDLMWQYPGLSEVLWKSRTQMGKYLKVYGEVTKGKLIYILVTKKRWVDAEGMDEILFFNNLSEIAKELQQQNIKEVVMPIPMIPSMKGRFLQVARAVLTAIEGRSINARIFLPHS
jgi:hypothetical protein